MQRDWEGTGDLQVIICMTLAVKLLQRFVIASWWIVHHNACQKNILQQTSIKKYPEK